MSGRKASCATLIKDGMLPGHTYKMIHMLFPELETAYRKIITDFSAESFDELVRRMNSDAFLGKGSVAVRLSSIPVLLPHSVQMELNSTVEAYVRYISQKKVQQ